MVSEREEADNPVPAEIVTLNMDLEDPFIHTLESLIPWKCVKLRYGDYSCYIVLENKRLWGDKQQLN